MTLAAMLLVANAAMAQDTKVNKQMPSKADMAKHRTEMMAKKYNLDDNQKAKLLELNTKYANQFGPMRGHRPGAQQMGCCKQQKPGCANCEKGKATKEKSCCKAQKAGDNQSQAKKRPKLTEEQKAERQKRFQEMKAKREAYVNELGTAEAVQRRQPENAGPSALQQEIIQRCRMAWPGYSRHQPSPLPQTPSLMPISGMGLFRSWLLSCRVWERSPHLKVKKWKGKRVKSAGTASYSTIIGIITQFVETGLFKRGSHL